MTDVGKAAAKGGTPPQSAFEQLRMAAAGAPLAPEPFLVEAAMAERSGDNARAETLLKQARLRDPRSTAARYLLADVLIRENKMSEGLAEIGIVTRLVPATSLQLIPALSEYSKLPGARDKLTKLLADNPQLRSPLLDALSADPDNAQLVVALAGNQAGSASGDAKRWEGRLVSGLVERGQLERAYDLWRQFAGLEPGSRPLVYNGQFSPSAAPPPFNWNYTSSSAGVAEAGGGHLRVLFYGRDGAMLASQLLLLPPARYEFSSPASGDVAQGALSWVLKCKGGQKLFESSIGASKPSTAFTVPSACPAQQLILRGSALDMPQNSDVQIGPVAIRKVAG